MLGIFPNPRNPQEGRTGFIENFRTFTTSLGTVLENRLERRRRMGIREPDLSTAISSSGWLAASNAVEARLYCLRDMDPTREISIAKTIRLTPQFQDEKIRAIALSDDLLAIITHCRLIVCEYRQAGSLEDNIVDVKRVDQDETWTPKSVSILQKGSIGPQLEASAWVAVGGEGKNGVKLFRYSYTNCWSSHRDRRILRCAQNTGSIPIVGFSSVRLNRADQFMVFGVTSSNQIYCWDVRQYDRGSQAIESSWNLDCSARRNAPSDRGRITSVAIFSSPSGTMYMFCTVDQKHGSQLLRSFIAPIQAFQRHRGTSAAHLPTLPETAIGRSVLSGAVTSNGLFVVALEDGEMRLLTLHGAYEGGLTSLGQSLAWRTSLKDVPGITISVKEYYGRLEIIAVDGRGHFMSANISVPDMPAPETLRLERPQTLELSGEGQAAIGELSSEEISQKSGSTEIREQAEDRIEVIPV